MIAGDGASRWTFMHMNGRCWRVGDVKNNGPDLVMPVEEEEIGGLF